MEDTPKAVESQRGSSLGTFRSSWQGPAASVPSKQRFVATADGGFKKVSNAGTQTLLSEDEIIKLQRADMVLQVLPMVLSETCVSFQIESLLTHEKDGFLFADGLQDLVDYFIEESGYACFDFLYFGVGC